MTTKKPGVTIKGLGVTIKKPGVTCLAMGCGLLAVGKERMPFEAPLFCIILEPFSLCHPE